MLVPVGQWYGLWPFYWLARPLLKNAKNRCMHRNFNGYMTLDFRAESIPEYHAKVCLHLVILVVTVFILLCLDNCQMCQELPWYSPQRWTSGSLVIGRYCSRSFITFTRHLLLSSYARHSESSSLEKNTKAIIHNKLTARGRLSFQTKVAWFHGMLRCMPLESDWWFWDW